MQLESTYAEAVAALLDATPTDALDRFDAELAAAVEDGRLDETTARTLRWWQRESVRAVRDHAAHVLPPVISGLVASHAARALEEPESESDEPTPEESRRRTLVAGLLALPDAASA